MIVSWPARIKDKGVIRTQFTHLIDVVPTILEASNLPAPKTVDGVLFLSTFASADAKPVRGHEYQSELPEGKRGLTWKTKYGAVGVDVVNKDLLADGMNEKGLCVNVLYHPGYADYPAFDPAKSATTMDSLDVCQYLLTTCTTIEEVCAALAKVNMIGVVEPAIGLAPPIPRSASSPTRRTATGNETMYELLTEDE